MMLRDYISWYREKIWNCYILRKHHEKMDSHGKCYRCGKQLREPSIRTI